MSDTEEDKKSDLRRANIRLALILGFIVLVLMFGSIFYWQSVELPQ